MKPVDFDYARPATIEAAQRLLQEHDNARVIAGGQTLGPMLNLRLARPGLLVDIARIPELTAADRDNGWLSIGAAVTHAAIEDDRLPDATNGFLGRVAAGIAYRAVRNRGTIGGSLAHADPAADWLSALTALGAELVLAGRDGRRTTRLAGFVSGAMTTILGADEVITSVRVPIQSRAVRCGFHKICRKAGDFADAIGVVVLEPEQGVRRAVAGAVGGRPIVIESVPEAPDLAAWTRLLREAGYTGDTYDMQIHAAALLRAFEEARR